MKYCRFTCISLLIVLLFSVPVLSWGQAGGGSWSRCPCNPILSPSPGSWDAYQVWIPRVVMNGTMYLMWYSGNMQGKPLQIGFATSTDGTNWSKHLVPVLSGTPGRWDSFSVSSGTVILDGDQFKMWYLGTRSAGIETAAFGYATSNDGITWTKYGNNPVLTKSSTGPDSSFINYPWVVKVGGLFKMWYNGADQTSVRHIFYAESSDGVNWNKKGPVLAQTSDWEAASIYSPSVVYAAGVYKMWYSGTNAGGSLSRIGFAYSNDGVSWTKYSANPVLSQGPSGSWDSYDSVDNQGVLLVGNTFKMYYSADQLQGTTLISYKIGYAEAPSDTVIPEFSVNGPLVILASLVTIAVIFVLGPKRKR